MNAFLPQGAVEALRRNDLVDGMVVAASGSALFMSIMLLTKIGDEDIDKDRVDLCFSQ